MFSMGIALLLLVDRGLQRSLQVTGGNSKHTRNTQEYLAVLFAYTVHYNEARIDSGIEKSD